MLRLDFKRRFIRFIEKSKSVHLIAEIDGRLIGILISRRVIEYLAETANLDRGQSFTTVVRNKQCLQSAAERAAERYGVNFGHMAVELADLKLAGLKAVPMAMEHEPEFNGRGVSASRVRAAKTRSARARALTSQPRTL